MSFTIELLPAFSDNYIFLVSDKDLGIAMVVDPGDGEVVLRELKKRDLFLALILNTHHHNDHTGGNDLLQREFGAPIIGPAKEKTPIVGLSRAVAHGDAVTFSNLRAEVLGTSGHTAGHISYYFPTLKALFCGDALFSLGCGRMFEGNPTQMWDSMKILRALPDDTEVFCAHEYSEENARFVSAIDKNNPTLKIRVAEIHAARKAGRPSIPFLLGKEKNCNPFLRADQPEFRQVLIKDGFGIADANPVAVFGALRAAKDKFDSPARRL